MKDGPLRANIDMARAMEEAREPAFYDARVIVRSPWTGELQVPNVAETDFPGTPIDKKTAINRRSLSMMLAVLAFSLGTMAFVSIASRPSDPTQPVKVERRASAGAAVDTASGRSESLENKKESELSAGYKESLDRALSSVSAREQVQELRRVTSMFPRGHEAFAELAQRLMDSRESRQEALHLAERSIELQQDNTLAWFVVGQIHHLSGKLTSAMVAYEKCARSSGWGEISAECRARLR